MQDKRFKVAHGLNQVGYLQLSVDKALETEHFSNGPFEDIPLQGSRIIMLNIEQMLFMWIRNKQRLSELALVVFGLYGKSNGLFEGAHMVKFEKEADLEECEQPTNPSETLEDGVGVTVHGVQVAQETHLQDHLIVGDATINNNVLSIAFKVKVPLLLFIERPAKYRNRSTFLVLKQLIYI